jgi:hypothetical protein
MDAGWQARFFDCLSICALNPNEMPLLIIAMFPQLCGKPRKQALEQAFKSGSHKLCESVYYQNTTKHATH